MDPKACLDEAESAINENDLETASEHLDDYDDWRENEGFEPKDGDARARKLRTLILYYEGENRAVCSACNGSGEGPADGTSCDVCRGTGEED